MSRSSAAAASSSGSLAFRGQQLRRSPLLLRLSGKCEKGKSDSVFSSLSDDGGNYDAGSSSLRRNSIFYFQDRKNICAKKVS